MLTLVIGAAASGKSKFAESLIALSPCSSRVYIATMAIYDHESELRARRHQLMRAGIGFSTIEAPSRLDLVSIPPNSAVLLEDLANLAANEVFGDLGFDNAKSRILRGVNHIAAASPLTVIVSNELFSDAVDYDPAMSNFISLMSDLNRDIAALSDSVFEVVCGIPLPRKEAAL